MPGPADYKLVRLVGGSPPGLNSLLPETDLEENQIPSGTGFDLTEDGYITDGTIPTATAAIQKTITISESGDDIPYLWHHKRLWNITGRATAGNTSNILHVGAMDYDAIFFYEFPPIPFDEDAQPILKLLPFEPDSMAVLKSTGMYVLRNLSDTRGFYQKTDVIQECACPAADQAAELDSVIYVNTDNAIMAYQNGRAEEISLPIRGVDFENLAVTIDPVNKYVIIGATHVYDVVNQKWFEYSGTTFSFKTRAYRNEDWSPFTTDRILFAVQNTGATDAQLTYKVKFEDEEFGDEETVDVLYDSGRYTIVQETLRDRRSCRRLQLEITGMDSDISLREIFLEARDLQQNDYTT